MKAEIKERKERKEHSVGANVFVISANSLAARGNVFVMGKRGPQCVN